MTPERWAQVKEIFAGAFPLPPDRRSAFLDGACGGDAALRSEVERLLAGSEEPSWPSPLHPTIAPGDSLAHFRIESRLGEGGMGVVYRAFDTRLQRTVALKVLPPEYAGDSGWKQRLMREARAASALNHPNIVTVYEIGSEGVVDFISMEYVEGRPLSQRIREKGLSQQEALHYALLIADALAMAHAAGVVHRDLKPANIMVTPDGRIKLLDFGLARQTKSADGATVTTTKLGEIAGTPYYMSPEQARGLQVDARTDIFSLGVVLYEMLTGRRPFEGDTASHAMLCIVEKAPTPLPAGTPAELQRIAGKMLEKDPAQRYQTAKDVATDLKRLNAQAASSNKGRRRMVLISIAAAVLGAAALFAYLRQTPALTSKDTILLADFVNTTGDSVFDDTLKQGLGAQLEQSPYISLLAEEQVRETLGYMGRAPGERITHQIGREICQRRGAKALIEGSIAPLGSHFAITLQAIHAVSSESLGRVQAEADSKENVLRALGDAGTQLRRKLGESLASIAKYDAPLIQATTSSLEALQAYSMAEQRSRAVDNPGALRYRKRAVELDPNFAIAYKSLSMAYLITGEQGAPALDAARKAYELRDRATELERLMIEAHYYRYITREVDKAIERLETATQVYPRSYIAWNNLWAVYSNTGQDEKALAAAREAERLVPSPTYIGAVALELFRLGRFAQEKAFCLQADTPYCHVDSYLIAVVEGNPAEQKRQLQRLDGLKNPTQARNLRRRIAEFQGKIREAGSAVPGTPSGPVILKSLALDYAAAGDCRHAVENARSALDMVNRSDILTGAGLALALCGNAQETLAAATQLENLLTSQEYNPALLPCMRALVKASESVDGGPYRYPLLQARYPFELAFCRGQFYLSRNDAAQAREQFQLILDHRAQDPLSILYAVSSVGLARSAKLTGDLAASRKAYQDFFALWKDADRDLPILAEAHREFEALR